MSLVDQLQIYLREKAPQQQEAIHMPPFVLLFDSSDGGVAMPTEAPDEDLGEALERMRATFRARQRNMRVQFVDAFAPRLAA